MKILSASVLGMLLFLGGDVFAQGTQESSTNPQQTAPFSANQDPAGLIFESWTFYFDQVERNATTVYFDNGSAAISPVEKDRLKDWAQNARQNLNLRNVIIASWSDKPYPTQSASSLSKADKDLAEKRNENLRDVLKGAGITRIEMFSMAERPNWFQRTFSTDSAQIKGDARNRNWASANEDRIASILERRGGASKAVIILRPRNDSTLTGGR